MTVHAPAKKALMWMFVDVLGSQLTPFLAFLVIARLIAPQEYGAFALAMSYIGLLTVVLYTGLADALIRVEDPDERFISTAFWMNLGLALVIAGLVQLSAPWVAAAYRAPSMEAPLRALSLLAPLQGLVSVQIAIFRKRLQTAVLAQRTLIGRAMGGVVGVVLALLGWGIWALVALQLVQSVVSALILWGASSWRPRWIFDWGRCRELLHFGSRFTVASLATEIVKIMDSLIVGLFFPPSAVGYYALAARLIEMATTLLLVPLRNMVMPFLSDRAANKDDFPNTYERMVVTALLAWLPLLLLLSLIAGPLVTDIFGEKWEPSVAVLQAMCMTAFTTPLWFFAGQAVSALGRPDVFLKLATYQIVVTAVCVAIGSLTSLTGVGLGWAVSSAVMVPIALAALAKVSRLSWRTMLRPVSRIWVAGLAFVAVSTAVDQGLDIFQIEPLINAAAAAAIGLLTYVLLLEIVLMPGRITSGLKGIKDAFSPSRA